MNKEKKAQVSDTTMLKKDIMTISKKIIKP